MSTAIEFNHVGKQYRLGLVSTKTLSHDLNRWWQTSILKKEDPYLRIGETNDRTTAGSSEYVWALRDIDFKVEQGDVVGIIGKNGAGKSTLLKLLSKVTGPTVGTIRARGRIGALLEVGTGFHPEMTGRENIYMNGAIMGMTKAEVSRKLDEIIDFSGCERYIDTPVKRYSSGMTVRLGFAVAAHLDPEILVVDEVLAVGDAEFQKKAIGKMQDVSRGEGRTVLFVSHNMESIMKLCQRGILLSNGAIDFGGNVDDVVDRYQQLFVHHFSTSWKTNTPKYVDGLGFTSFFLKKNDKVLDSTVTSEDHLSVVIEFDAKETHSDYTIGISLFDNRGRYVYRSLHTDLDSHTNAFLHKGMNKLEAELPIYFLESGSYNVVLDVSRHNSSWIVNPFIEKERVISFFMDSTSVFSEMHSTSAVVSPVATWLWK